jgi:hypothetical protein
MTRATRAFAARPDRASEAKLSGRSQVARSGKPGRAVSDVRRNARRAAALERNG